MMAVVGLFAVKLHMNADQMCNHEACERDKLNTHIYIYIDYLHLKWLMRIDQHVVFI